MGGRCSRDCRELDRPQPPGRVSPWVLSADEMGASGRKAKDRGQETWVAGWRGGASECCLVPPAAGRKQLGAARAQAATRVPKWNRLLCREPPVCHAGVCQQ